MDLKGSCRVGPLKPTNAPREIPGFRWSGSKKHISLKRDDLRFLQFILGRQRGFRFICGWAFSP